MVKIKQRAKSEAQKELRRQQILDAARHRLSQQSFDQINLIHLAADIGITKAALYRYFRNKETLFLALYQQALERFIQCVVSAATSGMSERGADMKVSDAIISALDDCPEYAQLSAILHIMLEQNLREDEAREFKRELLMRFGVLVELMQKYAGFNEQDASTRLLQIHQAIIGAWHVSHPSDVLRNVLAEPEFERLNLNFSTTVRQHIQQLLEVDN